jgi:hypothetical protein
MSLADGPASQAADNAAAKKAQVAQNYGKIALSFEANRGQADKAVKFLSNGIGYSLFLTDSSAVLALTKPDASSAKPGKTAGKGLKAASAHPARKTDVVRMDLAGASRAMQVIGSDPLPGTANYFIGNDPAQWHSGVPTFAKVRYAGVYPGIDLVYYGNQRQLEYDFIVAPGASPKPIRLEFAGAKKLDLTADGDLTVSAVNGEIAFHKPVIYQLIKDGLRQPVDGQFALLTKNTIGFTLGRYDHSKPLVIDPVLSYSTYLGDVATASGIAADSSGNVYVVGSTSSANFPVTAGAAQSLYGGSVNSVANIFVTKLNPTGTALVYSTYLGGSGSGSSIFFYGDYGQGIAVDGSGDAYVTGVTSSTNFPVTTGAFQTANNSTNSLLKENAFVTKLNPTGTALLYSTYIGGFHQDAGYGIAVDSLDFAYVIGSTTSTNFPITNGAFQTINFADTTDGWGSAFVTKLNTTGTALVYSTYLGRTGYGAKGAGIAVDSSGDAYVTGSAASADFPITTGAFQTTNKAAANAGPQTVAYNVFVTKFNPTGTALVYSTYLGGSIDDYGAGIALDGSGDAYVTGYTDSADFPVAGSAYQSTNHAYANEGSTGFVTEVNPVGTGLVYSTYLGGSGIPPLGNDESGSGDASYAIAVDGLGDAYVTGIATSSNFPTTSGAYQTVNNAAGLYQSKGTIGVNAFITKLNPSGSTLVYSTYLGGNTQDFGYGIAQDGVGGVYVAGGTSSTNFPTTTGAYQIANAGDGDAFIAKLAIGSVVNTIATTTTVTSSANPQVQGDTVTFTVTVAPESGTTIPTGNLVFSVDGTSASTVALGDTGEADYITSSLAAGPHTILANYAGSIAYTASSDSQTETISQPLASTTTSIAQSGSPGNYTLTATVAGSGTLTAAPTGTVSFLDTSNGNAVVATATLNASTSGALTWTNTQTPATEPAPQSIVVGDFNGDGIPDIAAGSNGYVSILIGNGDGTFKAANNLATYGDNQYMATAAFETGQPAGIIMVSNGASATNEVQLILGNGSGGETVEAPFSLPCGSASAVVIGDFNGDGKPDFLVACLESGNPVIAIFLGNGNGTFGAPTVIPTGSAILAIGVGNFRGNGKTDIAVVNAITGTSDMQTISVFENDGSGNFTPGPSVTSTGMSPTSLVVADFNGDGKADLALVNSGGNSVSILLSQGNGTFSQAASPQTGSSPSSIAVGDFNGDGIPDLAVANSGDNTVTILLGNGNGTFTAATPPPTGNTPSALAVGDFVTGSGPGLAVANSGAVGGSVTVLNQQTTATATAKATATATGISPAGSGAHLVEASYPGDSNYVASVSSTTSLNGQTVSTSLSLTPNPTSSTVGHQVLLTATLTPFSSGGNSTNGESVTFYSGSTSLGTGTLSSGVATLSTTALPTGTDSLTVKFAGDANFNASTSTAVNFVVSAAAPAATPTFSVPAGTYTSTQSVTITDSTTGAAIYYTTNGTTPTTSSTLYSGAITVSATETVEAIAVATGYTNSAVASATYTIQTQTAAATPVFSPAAGSYTSTQSVTITDATSGAAIYYTTNGNPPTTSSTLYNGAITVSATEAVEAIAVATGYTNSAVATADYIILVAAPGYTLSASPSTLTIQSGSTASTVITLTPTGGFTGTVNFSCGTLPSLVTCSFAPTSLTVASATPQTTMLTIGTTGTTTAFLNNGPSGTVLPGILAALILLPLGFMRRVLRTRKAGSPWLACLLLLAGATLAAAGMLGMAGCGGSSKPSTPAGTYSIPITVTSGGTTVPLNLSITVQ